MDRHIAPSDKLNIAVVGLGGVGISNIKAVYETENIVALCDVDWKHSKPLLDCFPRTKKYKDFRRMFNEMVMMGVLAVRLQPLNKILEWDGANMQFTNIGDDGAINFMISEGFTIEAGHPSFNAKMSEPINAKEFATELIKHNYRDGWNLPVMP
jgi:hypothetical protein